MYDKVFSTTIIYISLYNNRPLLALFKIIISTYFLSCLLNMVFVKLSHGTYKCHTCHFLECKDGQTWFILLEATFANCTSFANYNFLQSSSAFHKSRIWVNFETKSQGNVMFLNTMFLEYFFMYVTYNYFIFWKNQ